MTITDCFTDVRSKLESNHYPMIATMRLQFNNLKKEEASTQKYSDKTVWRAKERLNRNVAELIKGGGLRSHANWKTANVEIVEDQEGKEPRKWKEWISRETGEMILERKAAMERDNEETAKDLKKEIRKVVKMDRQMDKRAHKTGAKQQGTMGRIKVHRTAIQAKALSKKRQARKNGKHGRKSRSHKRV